MFLGEIVKSGFVYTPTRLDPTKKSNKKIQKTLDKIAKRCYNNNVR